MLQSHAKIERKGLPWNKCLHHAHRATIYKNVENTRCLESIFLKMIPLFWWSTMLLAFLFPGWVNNSILRYFRILSISLWAVSFNNQWLAVGAIGRHGGHAVWRAEEGTGHELAHAPIQRLNGMERIALGRISPQGAAIYKNVEVLDAFIWKYSPWNDSAFLML